ncbi:hypothetical protein F2P81_012660 [Scophthalmus maximus]|uniref:Zona pellucida sperm-binding protein 1/4 Ig-like domain-containing protein n=1 Tax=Scophthalmus maximus TaxID=52904 RepID=A0A6A4SY10_SCOMX|nr:hypothetical protein F2P81_012660 [Scophthalmus maximus]
MTTEEQLKDSHTSIVKDDSQDVTATLASLNCFNGLSIDAGAFVQRPTLQGRVYFRSVGSDDESVVPTRYGSLAFRDGDQKLTPALHSLMESKLKRLDPIVQCRDNLMTLKVKRAGAPYVLVNSGVGLLTPLTQMPSSCGFSVKRSRRDVLFSAPYQGCHVTQQGGDYVLPLRLWGAPMAMSCPAVLPPPSVSCFPTGMVVKVGGITANGLKVKVSGAWMSLSSVCGSCGFAVEATSEGLTVTAPYNIGLCIEIKDERHLLSLLMVDVELLVTCPSLPDIKPTTTTTTTTMPPSDSGQVLQFPQFHQFPMFQQYPVLPLPSYPANTPSPTTGTVAPLPQQPQIPSGPNNKHQEAPADQHPSFPFMQQYPQLPQYVFFPRPVPPTQATPTKNTAAATVAQLPSGPAAESGPKNENQGAPAGQHPSFPFMQQYPQLPQYVFFPRPVPPTQATPTKNTAAAATTTEAKLPQLPQLPSGPAAESGPKNENQGAPAGQHPSFPFMQQYPQLPQYVFFPRPVPPTQATPTKNTAAAATTTEAKLPQLPQFPSGPAAESGPNNENQGAPAGQHPSFPFMQQYPQLPQYVFFPRPVPPTQTTPTKNTAAATEAQLPSGPGAELGPKNENQGAPAGQYPSFPFMQQYPQLPQYVFFPGPVPPTQATPTKNTAAATTEAKLPQMPQFPSGPAAESGPNNENQGATAGQHPTFPFMQQYPQLPQYVFFPRPVPPTQTTPTKNNAAATEAQLPSGPGAELGPKNENQGAPAGQYPSFPFMQQYPQLPQYVFFPGPVPPTQATPTKNTAAATTEAKSPQMPQSQQLPQFLVPPRYNFLTFPKLQLSPEGQPQAIPNPKPLIQQPKPQSVYPRIYQMPVLYPPHSELLLESNVFPCCPAFSGATGGSRGLSFSRCRLARCPGRL